MEDWDLKASVDVTFLALVLWREARGEPHDCKIAVASSIMNRVMRPSWWGRTLLEVVTKKWQYSSMTDPKDAQLTTWPRYDATFIECMEVARDVLMGRVASLTPGADSYYDVSIAAPHWATPGTFVGQVGRIRFYNLDRDVEVTPQGGKP